MPQNKQPLTSLFYSYTGHGKTTQAYDFARHYIWDILHKKTRLITCDGGGIGPFRDSGMVDAGICDVMDITEKPTPLAHMRRISEGYWHRKTKSGDYVLRAESPFVTTREEWEGIGLVLVEGLTSIADLFISRLGTLKGEAGFQHSTEIEEDGVFLGGLQKGHFGMVQGELHRLVVLGFKALPVDHVIFTAHINQGVDGKRGDGTTVYGPATCGSAQIASVPSWFSNCIHLFREESEGEGKVWSAWVEDHNDPITDIPYLAKVRILPELRPRLLERLGGVGCLRLRPDRGISALYKVMDKMNKEYREGNPFKV